MLLNRTIQTIGAWVVSMDMTPPYAFSALDYSQRSASYSRTRLKQSMGKLFFLFAVFPFALKKVRFFKGYILIWKKK
jgi:hypothetical protein